MTENSPNSANLANLKESANPKSKSENLRKAKAAKKDEFYTQYKDIENELRHYSAHFKNKVVYCNCDDPMQSNFFVYFLLFFKQLNLKKLISTCYQSMNFDKITQNESPRKSVKIEVDRKNYSKFNAYNELLSLSLWQPR